MVMNKKDGFTIVELAVVITVIGILVAVSYFGFSAWRDRVAKTEVISDLRTVSTAMKSARNWGKGFPVFPARTIFNGENEDANKIFKQSQNVTVTYFNGDNGSYCIDAVSTAKSSISMHYLSSNTTQEPQEGLCPGHYGPFVESGGVVTTLAGTGVGGYVDGAASVAQFYTPRGIAVNGLTGKIYVTEINNHRVRLVDYDGSVSTFAGGPALVHTLKAIAISPGGTVYVAEANRNRILTISSSGTMTTFSGVASPSGYVDGSLSAARYSNIMGMVFGSDGTLYIADAGNRRIRKITPGGAVSTVAGNGTRGSSNGTGTAASFGDLRDITIDSDDNLYVTDYFYHTIRKITPLGVTSTIAGNGSSGFVDGIGTAARFAGPSGIAYGSNGKLYVTDKANNRIRVIEQDGRVTTLAGAASSGRVDGIGVNARFNQPDGIAVAPDGTVYVTEDNGNVIRTIK